MTFVPKPKMVMRSLYVYLDVWEKAKAKAEANDEDISTVVRRLLERYVKRG